MFLPPPRIPRHTDHLPPSTLLRDIHPDTADAVDMIEDLHTRVWRLVSVLEDSRPDGSGQVWRAALDAPKPSSTGSPRSGGDAGTHRVRSGTVG